MQLNRIDYTKSNANVVNAVDLPIIGKHIENKAYRCWDSFWADIKWIVHNVKSRKPNAVEKSALKWLMTFTRREMDSIRLCHECYKNANEHPADWFSMVCNERHPVVWAKQDTYPYWAAKLMASNTDDDTVVVWFFGSECKHAKINSKFCMKYSKNCLSTNFGEHRDEWDKAQLVSQPAASPMPFDSLRPLEIYIMLLYHFYALS